MTEEDEPPPEELEADKDDEYEDEDPETFGERLWGLLEMFPDGVRDTIEMLTDFTISSVKGSYRLSRSVFWVLCSSSVLLFAPVIIEVERLNIRESAISQQKEVLFGTSPLCVTTPSSS